MISLGCVFLLLFGWLGVCVYYVVLLVSLVFLVAVNSVGYIVYLGFVILGMMVLFGLIVVTVWFWLLFTCCLLCCDCLFGVNFVIVRLLLCLFVCEIIVLMFE